MVTIVRKDIKDKQRKGGVCGYGRITFTTGERVYPIVRIDYGEDEEIQVSEEE